MSHVKLYGDGIGFVTDEVSTIPTTHANLDEESRIKFITDLAAISRGKYEAKDAKQRYRALLTEAAPLNYSIKNTADEFVIPTSFKLMKKLAQEFDIEFRKDDMSFTIEVSDKLNMRLCEVGLIKDEIADIFGHDEIKFVRTIGTPSRPFEFLPVVVYARLSNAESISDANIILSDLHGNIFITMHRRWFNNMVMRFSYDEKEISNSSVTKIYTNMRTLLNAGIRYEDIPYNQPEDMQDFKAIRAKIPMFSFNHIITHTMLSKETRSDRVVEGNLQEIWLPEDAPQKIYDYVIQLDRETGYGKKLIEWLYKFKLSTQYDVELLKHILVTKFSQSEVQDLFKMAGYKAEIYQRAMLEFRYKEFVVVGWLNDPLGWEHLLVERNGLCEVWDNWTQDTTAVFVNGIKELDSFKFIKE